MLIHVRRIKKKFHTVFSNLNYKIVIKPQIQKKWGGKPEECY